LAIANITLGTKAPIASPTFTGIPAADTATAGTNTTQLATTAFVFEANAGLRANVAANLQLIRTDLITNYATINSPGFTGTPTADQAAAGSNTNQIANTSFVFEANTGSIAFMLYQLEANNISHSANVTAANIAHTANVTAANLSIRTLDANVGAYQTWANANVSLANVNFTTLDANVGTLWSNVGTAWSNISAQSYNPVFYGESLSITSGNVSQFGGNVTTWKTGTQADSAGVSGDVAGQFKFNYAGAGTEVWVCVRGYDSGSDTDPIWVKLGVTVV
jgi:hypothetical protein